jgi:hypothetical protein
MCVRASLHMHRSTISFPTAAAYSSGVMDTGGKILHMLRAGRQETDEEALKRK